MDFSKVINQELGIKEKESTVKPVVNRRVFEKNRVLEKVNVGTPGHADHDRPPFDISTYVPNKYLVEALKRFSGSILNISPINGAVEFIFSK